MITRDKALLVNGVPSVELLRGVITEFQKDESRRDRLWAYYERKHDICKRTRRSGLPNNRLVHDFPGYIVSMATGYLVGNAVGYADEGQQDALAIKSDIHKFSMVPDLTDQEFAGNSSGVAMKFKLLGLEQLTKIKERWFREGLRWRLRLFAHFLSVKGSPALDADAVSMTFTRSLPVNDLEIAQTVQTLQNLVPDEILLKQVPWVSDVEKALRMLEKQKAEAAKLQSQRFGGYADGNKPPAKEDEEE